jgi:hypothetical protein
MLPKSHLKDNAGIAPRQFFRDFTFFKTDSLESATRYPALPVYVQG